MRETKAPAAKRGLLQLTGVVVDILQKVERLPQPGEEVAAEAALVGAGGGFNALAAARRAGADAAYGGALGVGPFADIARRALADIGAPALQRRMMPIDQGFCTVLVERGGERAYVYSAGAERAATAEDLAALPAAEFAWVLLGGYAAPPDAEPDIFGDWLAALPLGVRLMFDPTPLVLAVGRARVAKALARADWVSANRSEAEALTGKTPALAARALSQGREGAIVRDGARGCWISQAGGAVRLIEGFRVEAVDTTGAGDAHIGAFIAARIAGRTTFDAARFANAAAALSVTRLGAATAPGLDEASAFLGTRV
ncbi:MAG TPA: PfkB family carbohydrate kinase [Roseiarcus sp.]|nr:PfkB family carbohydrate kinase [Roseiarcus sp.]